MILPIAAPLRRYLEGLPSSDDVNSEEVHQLYVAVGKDALASAAARLPDLG